MRGARVINNQICYPEKEIFEIKKLFDTRYNLYKDCYHHRVTQAYECLLLDILKASSSMFDFMAAINDPNLYILLDDTILHDIRISTSKEL
jgi:HD superfamily phosphohydrolase